MKKGNSARASGLVITTSIATAAIAAGPWTGEFKVCTIALTIFVAAALATFSADIDGEQS